MVLGGGGALLLAVGITYLGRHSGAISKILDRGWQRLLVPR